MIKIGYLLTYFVLAMSVLLSNRKEGELTNWQFDWGGRL